MPWWNSQSSIHVSCFYSIIGILTKTCIILGLTSYQTVIKSGLWMLYGDMYRKITGQCDQHSDLLCLKPYTCPGVFPLWPTLLWPNQVGATPAPQPVNWRAANLCVWHQDNIEKYCSVNCGNFIASLESVKMQGGKTVKRTVKMSLKMKSSPRLCSSQCQIPSQKENYRPNILANVFSLRHLVWKHTTTCAALNLGKSQEGNTWGKAWGSQCMRPEKGVGGDSWILRSNSRL